MTPQEINTAVAAKLGHNWYVHGGIGCPHYDGPDYCHSIEAAWEICGPRFSGVWRIGDKWAAFFDAAHMDYILASILREFPWTEEVEMMRHFGKYPVSCAETAPMAICLAFLKLP